MELDTIKRMVRVFYPHARTIESRTGYNVSHCETFRTHKSEERAWLYIVKLINKQITTYQQIQEPDDGT